MTMEISIRYSSLSQFRPEQPQYHSLEHFKQLTMGAVNSDSLALHLHWTDSDCSHVPPAKYLLMTLHYPLITLTLRLLPSSNLTLSQP